MSVWDAAGFLASGLVIAAFCTKDIIPLRAVALASNVAFLMYGIGLSLAPVWLLHAILLPINCWRLAQGVSVQRIRVLRNGPQSVRRSSIIKCDLFRGVGRGQQLFRRKFTRADQ